MARGDDKEPLDAGGVLDGIATALPLQLRSACAFTLASAKLVGFEFTGLAALLGEAGAADLADARRLAEKAVALGGQPGDGVPALDLPRTPKAIVRRLIDYERETIEALQDIIPATGQTGESEALEHRLEHMIMRKQELVDALVRARRSAP
jgi:bacterioferritin (cytochrome b1)